MLKQLTDKMQLMRHFLGSVRRRGMMRTVRISFYEVWFERKFRAATGFVIPVDRLDFNEEAKSHASPYFPSSYLFLHEAFAAGALDCRNHVFVDYGCGMGRALLFASTLPFKRIVGVELSPSLCETAVQNLERYYRLRGKTMPEWQVVNADARRFLIPDDATVFYMFNAFDALVVGKVLDNIVTSVLAHPRKCYLIYANPIHERLITEQGFEKIANPTTDYVIYTHQ
jgi:SAM-dependent methyltransferase